MATVPAEKTALAVVSPPSLVARVAARFGVEPNKMLTTLKATAFRSEKEATNEQMMALLVVADQYGLNPWTREIYAFPDKRSGIVPVVGVDGWSRIINEHPQYDGCDFVDGPVDAKGIPEWIECTLHRKDRGHATTVREYFAECRRATDPWSSHPRRMLRHKAFMQAGRIGFAFVGIYDEDEAQRIIEGNVVHVQEAPAALAAINDAVSGNGAETSGSSTSNEAAKPEVAKPPTFAEIAEAFKKATTIDQVNDAEAVIDASIDDKKQRAELHDLAKATRLALEG
jgi:phage recombination protein Bet